MAEHTESNSSNSPPPGETRTEAPLQEAPRVRSSNPYSQYYGYHLPQSERPIREYAAVLFQHRYLILICFLIGALGAQIYNRRAPRIYTASATVNIGAYKPAVEGALSEMLRSESINPEYTGSQISMLSGYTLANYVLLKNEKIRRFIDPLDSQRPLIDEAILHAQDKESADFERRHDPLLRSVAGTSRLEAIIDLPVGMLDAYMGLTSYTIVPSTSLVRVSAYTGDPEMAGIIANAHAQGFIDLVRAQRIMSATVNLDYLTRRTQQVADLVQTRQQELVKFARDHAIDPHDALNGDQVNAEKFHGIVQSIAAAVQERATIDGELRELRSSSGNRTPRVTGNMQPAFLRMTEIQSDMDIVRRRTPNHPVLKTLASEYKVLEKTLRQSNDQEVSEKEIALRAAEARERLLTSELEKLRETEKAGAGDRLQYAILDREHKAAEEQLEELKKRLADVEIHAQSDQENVTMTDLAVTPLYPISPDTRSNMISGCFVGILFGIAVAFLMDFRNNAVCTVSELERISESTVLGVVPTFSRRRVKARRDELERYSKAARDDQARRSSLGSEPVAPSVNSIQTVSLGGEADPASTSKLDTVKLGPRASESSKLVKAGLTSKDLEEFVESSSSTSHSIVCVYSPLSREAEAFRNIRTTLKYARHRKTPQIILVTSGRKGDGKTTVACNLAASLAQASSKTLLIDADMRLPTVHNHFNQIRSANGLSDYLQDQITLAEATSDSGIKNLSLIFAGSPTPTPAELLETRRMGALLNTLSTDYDHIVIDTPPVAHVTDALLLASRVDGVVMVARSGKTPTPVVEFAASRLRQMNATLLGVILNDVKRTNTYREAEYYFIAEDYY